jgi:DNA-binding NarL/FixJ family response regulator
VRIVIAEDAVLLRAGLQRLLADAGHEVVAIVGEGLALVAAVDRHHPDLAIVDVRMPPTFTDEGLRAAIEVRNRQPDVRVLVLSQYVEEEYAAELLADNTEGVGYLLKDRVADVGEFLDTVARVGAGGVAIDPEVVSQLLDPEVVSQLLGRQRRTDPLSRLTTREREVLALMAEGHANVAIANELVVTPGAVEKHIGNVFAKLGLPDGDNHNRRVLAVLAYLRQRLTACRGRVLAADLGRRATITVARHPRTVAPHERQRAGGRGPQGS